jgi:hypothetical protein
VTHYLIVRQIFLFSIAESAKRPSQWTAPDVLRRKKREGEKETKHASYSPAIIQLEKHSFGEV